MCFSSICSSHIENDFPPVIRQRKPYLEVAHYSYNTASPSYFCLHYKRICSLWQCLLQGPCVANLCMCTVSTSTLVNVAESLGMPLVSCLGPACTYHVQLKKYYVTMYTFCFVACVTKSRAKPQQSPSMEKHAHPPGWFIALYTQHLLNSQSFEFEICILQALNMPLIRCTNVFFQGRLSRHITSPSEKTRPES